MTALFFCLAPAQCSIAAKLTETSRELIRRVGSSTDLGYSSSVEGTGEVDVAMAHPQYSAAPGSSTRFLRQEQRTSGGILCLPEGGGRW